jgi:hypothetical protein
VKVVLLLECLSRKAPGLLPGLLPPPEIMGSFLRAVPAVFLMSEYSSVGVMVFCIVFCLAAPTMRADLFPLIRFKFYWANLPVEAK